MTVDTQRFRKTHREPDEQTPELRLAAARLPALTTYERAQARGRILRYLRGQVEPHTRLDELHLYPELATRLEDPLIAASMNYDHLAIRHWIELIAAADLTDTARLQQLLYGLDALIRVHQWKENELLLASLESSASAAPAGRG
jgi:hypothetical protein